jgi:hypothetical protein
MANRAIPPSPNPAAHPCSHVIEAQAYARGAEDFAANLPKVFVQPIRPQPQAARSGLILKGFFGQRRA